MTTEMPTETIRRPPIHVEHYCEHTGCKAWGAFGYAVGKGEPRWYCMEHRHVGERAT